MNVRKILLIDDDPDLRLIGRVSLTRVGKWEVVEAASGPEALERAREEQPDLILLDVMMPKRDGYDVCQTVRADPRYADVKIIVLTAKGGALDGEKALALGADAFFSKPFGLEELSCRVKELLAESPGDDG